MADGRILKDVIFWHPKIVNVVTRACCPSCGHIIGGRMKWEYPPIAETMQTMGESERIIYVGTVLCGCPDCEAYFTQQEVQGLDYDAVSNYIEKSAPKKTSP